jgi:hypothetical protein
MCCLRLVLAVWIGTTAGSVAVHIPDRLSAANAELISILKCRFLRVSHLKAALLIRWKWYYSVYSRSYAMGE